MAYKFKEIKRNGSVDKQGQTNYTRTIQVEVTGGGPYTDGPSSIAGAVLSHYGLSTWAPYDTGSESDPTALLKGIKADQTEEKNIWEVELQFDSEPFSGQDDPDNDTEPEARPLRFRFGTVKSTKILTEDFDAPPKKIQNSAGLPFAGGGIEVPCSIPTLTVTFWRLAFDFTTVDQFVDHVNDAVWYGYPAGSLKIVDISADSVWEYGARYWEVNVTIEYKKFWKPTQIADMGMVENVAGDYTDPAQYKPITMFGQVVNEPVFLDGAGKVKTTPGPHFLDFILVEEVDFDDLFLP